MSALSRLLILMTLLAGCGQAPDTNVTPQSDPALPEHLIEHVDGLDVELDPPARVDAVFVDDQLRQLRENLVAGDAQAENLYLFHDGEPVFYRSRGEWRADGAAHGLRAWAEFGLDGAPIGSAKLLDGEPVPVPPSESSAIRQRARELHAAVTEVAEATGCDFNKSLRAAGMLVTVIVPVSDGCPGGQLNLYARSSKGSTVHEFHRNGRVVAAWLRDFNGDGQAELLVASEGENGERLRGWQVDEGRFSEISLGELTPAQRASFGGENRYRVEDKRLLRRYRAADPERGSIRLRYNWNNSRWLPEPVTPRDTLQARLAGDWVGPFELRIPDGGPITVTAACGAVPFPALALPGDLLLVSAPLAAPADCDGSGLPLAPGSWLAETANGELRLTALDGETELEFVRRGAAGTVEKPPVSGSPGD